ncbi:MAG TPA: hypothetical protein VHE55_02935 [Fimbriimonadaceae bacterium]|nr:hypothetical protein [Fimbriimonadaceae bacterium]
MILSAVALSLALVWPQQATTAPARDDKPVTLSRTFVKGEKLQYGISSNLHVEGRQIGLQTFIPVDFDYAYKFTTEVTGLKGDGVAEIHYQRPNIVEIQEQTYDKPETKKTEAVDWNLSLMVSPINKVLDIKDLNPKKPPKKPNGGGGNEGGGLLRYRLGGGAAQGSLDALLDQFLGEVHQLALNIGSLEMLDFAPSLPLDDVKVGDTWKMTVGYQPQKLKGKEGKQAVQRLDYTFTYKGLVDVNGKKYYRVAAALDLNTDIGAFINQLLDQKPEESKLKSIPLTLKQNIDFDLDMGSKRTVHALSKASGSFAINTTLADEALEEEKFTGQTELKLLASGMASPPKPAQAPVRHGGGH